MLSHFSTARLTLARLGGPALACAARTCRLLPEAPPERDCLAGPVLCQHVGLLALLQEPDAPHSCWPQRVQPDQPSPWRRVPPCCFLQDSSHETGGLSCGMLLGDRGRQLAQRSTLGGGGLGASGLAGDLSRSLRRQGERDGGGGGFRTGGAFLARGIPLTWGGGLPFGGGGMLLLALRRGQRGLSSSSSSDE